MISPRNVGPDTILLFFLSSSSSSFFSFRVSEILSPSEAENPITSAAEEEFHFLWLPLLLRVHKRESRGPMFSDLESFVGFEIRTSSEKFRNSIYFLLA